jgi:uncharacterized membrane protein YphA (DoxX/SURF4 family)
MGKLIHQGRCLFAAAIIAFGIENLICAHTRHVVTGVPWFPAAPWLAYVVGLALLAAGLSIAANINARLSATLLGIFFLLLVLIFEIHKVAIQPLDLSIRTVFFETLSMSASAFMLAGILTAEKILPSRWERVIDALIKIAPYLFAISLIAFGITHFLVLPFIASLIPSWIPGALFLAYFTGAAFIAAGISIATKIMACWAAFLLGLMFLLWFLLLHLPRIMSAARSHNPDEWSSAFIALGMCGGSWICARYSRTQN